MILGAKTRASVVAMAVLAGASWTMATTATARAAGDSPSGVYPIYAHQPGAPFNDLASRLLAGAAARYHLLPMETIDIAAPPTATAAATAAIKVAKDKVRKLAFDEAAPQLNEAANAVASNGGAGLTTEQLSDLYLFRGMTVARADWKPERSVDQAAQARAYADYVRAISLTPTRALNPRETPPQVMEDWARAQADVRARARGTLVVRGPADATVSFDGDSAAPVGGGATYQDVVYGEHLIHVEQVGYAPWGAVVALDRPAQEVLIPARPALVLDDQVAGAHARRMGAKFAVIGEVKLGTPSLQMELRLVDATGIKHDATTVSLPSEPGTVDAAVMRLDEEARRIEHLGLAPSSSDDAPPAATGPALPAAADSPVTPRDAPIVSLTPLSPAKPRLGDDPAGWARDHWPLVIAVGSLLTTSLIFSISVAANR